MKKNSKSTIFLLIFSLLWIGKEIHGLVDPPNYNFQLAELENFAPGVKLDSLKEKYGKGLLINKSKGNNVLKFTIFHTRFHFPLLLQALNNEILDYFCRLPSYFIHDIFLKSLVEKYGKQDAYRKNGEEAIYYWRNENGNEIFYMASCSITCFPNYLSVSKKSLGKKSLINSMIE